MKNLKKYYLHKPFLFVTLVFLNILVSVLFESVTLILYYIVDLIQDGSKFTLFLYIGLAAFFAIICAVLLNLFVEYTTHKYVDEITEIYRNDVFHGILNMDLSEMNSKQVGEYLSILNKDVNSISQQHFTAVFDLISYSSLFLTAFALSIYLNYIVTLFIFFMASMVVIVPALFSKAICTKYDEYSIAVAELSKYLESFLGGSLIVANCEAIHKISEIVDKVDKTMLKKENKYWKLISINNNVVQFLNLLLEFFTVFFVCLLAYYGKTTISMCVAFMQIGITIYSPLMQIINSYSYIKSVKKVVERLAKFTEFNGKKQTKCVLKEPSIMVHDLTIAYDDRKVLDDVSYNFEFGKKYMLTGKSGIGKSTLLNSIFGYINKESGEIDFFNENERVENTNDNSNSLIGYVHQKPYLFIGSLVENITMFSKEPDMEKVNKIIKQCRLDDFASQRGLNTPLDNSNNSISLGEMQRISLARILYLDKPILFLDEVTSSLDENNAHAINDAIQELDNKLVIWISHDKDTQNLTWIDQKLIIQDSKLIEA